VGLGAPTSLMNLAPHSIATPLIFPKFKMAAAAILDFQFMWIWPFHIGSVVFVFCTKFDSNICYRHWDRRTYYASDLYLMTTRELTSGFDFLSRGHLLMIVHNLQRLYISVCFVAVFGNDIINGQCSSYLLRQWTRELYACCSAAAKINNMDKVV